MKTNKIAVFIIISGYSIANNSMATNHFLQINLINRILSLFARQGTQQSAQNITPAVTPAPVIQKKYPNPIAYSQHTPIRSIVIVPHGMNRYEWETKENEVANTIPDQEIFYSFKLWCKRVKADAYMKAKDQNNLQSFSAAPTETPNIIYMQLICGSRPRIQIPRQQ